MAGAAFDRAVNLAIAVRQELHPSERSRQLRFHDNPAWQAGLDFNAQDHSVLSLIEPGHEPMDVIAKDKISHFQLGSPLIISIELRIDDHHGGRPLDTEGAVFGLNYAIKSNMVNAFRVGFNRVHYISNSPS